MIDNLLETIKKEEFIKLLGETDKWDSLIINKRKPHTYRIFTQLGENRVCLHKFDTCSSEESFAHPHPWPGAFMVLHGAYRMKLGKSKDRFSDPEWVSELIMGAGSVYQIVDPLVWHTVTPLETTYTIMMNGPSWDKETAHTQVRTTKGKDLEKLPLDELESQLDSFYHLLYGANYAF